MGLIIETDPYEKFKKENLNLVQAMALCSATRTSIETIEKLAKAFFNGGRMVGMEQGVMLAREALTEAMEKYEISKGD